MTTLASDTAYHSFAGEVEARTPPRYAAFIPSARHQLLPIARQRITFALCASRIGDIRQGRQQAGKRDHGNISVAEGAGYRFRLSPARVDSFNATRPSPGIVLRVHITELNSPAPDPDVSSYENGGEAGTLGTITKYHAKSMIYTTQRWRHSPTES